MSLAGPAAADANLVSNPGFETGDLTGWSCSSTDSVVSSPVHSGSHALSGAANNSDDAQCSQTVSVLPNSAYTLSAYVEGDYVYLGSDASSPTWTPSASGWQQLTSNFTTGAATTSVTIYIHGWYAQGTYYADDVSLTGPGSGTQVPGAPTGLTVTGTSTSSASLSWSAPSGSTVTGYDVYRGGTQVGTTSSTSFTDTGLAASTSYTYTVAAYNSVGVGSTSSSVTATTQSSGSGGGGAFAPYADLTSLQEPMLDQAATQAGLKDFTAAFVTGSGCTPIWGDTLPVTNDPTVSGEISKAESEGAQPIVSFGGSSGTELAQACSDQTQLTAAYQSVIDTLGVKRIDFDIEGALIAYPAVNDLRNKAVDTLEANNPGLVVSFTIPTLPTGPDYYGLQFLQQAKNDGTRVDVVNVMAMDYYGSADPGDMGAQAVSAAQNTLSALQNLWPSDSYANVGVTPMIGQNDDSAETFSEANAHTLVDFAQSNHLGRLAFWSVNRDQPCGGSVSGLPNCSEISQSALDFTRIFNAFTG
jgi:hypothetical protein